MKEFGAGLRQTVNFIKDVGGISKIGVGNTCENSYTGETEKEFCDLITQKYTKVALQATRATSSLPGATTLAEYEIGIIGFVTPNVEVFAHISLFESKYSLTVGRSFFRDYPYLGNSNFQTYLNQLKR